MKKFFAKHSRDLVFSGVIVLCLCLIIVAVLLLNQYADVLSEQSEIKVELYTKETTETLNEHLKQLQGLTDSAAIYVEKAHSGDEIAGTLREACLNREDLGTGLFFRYFSGETEYNEYGELFSASGFPEDAAVLAAAGSGKSVCLGTVYDSSSNQKRVAFCAPVKNNPMVDTVVLFCPLHEIKDFREDLNAEKLALTEFLAFCDVKDGYILDMLYTADDYHIAANANVLDELRKITNSKETVDLIERTIQQSGTAVIPATVNGESYAIAVGGGADGSGLCIIGLYRNASVYTSGYQFMNVILTSIAILFAILIFFAIYLVVTRRMMNRKILDFGTEDPVLHCPTSLKFEREVPELLSRYKGTKFAVVATSVRHFGYITETRGEQAAEEVLRFLTLIFGKTLQTGETFAYLSDSGFALFLHYKDTSLLLNRLRGLHALAYENSNARKYNIILEFGIYEIDREQPVSPHKMIERAILARDNETDDMRNHFRLYKEDYFESYMQNADIEIQMEQALENDEFKVFFQPKYNIATDRIDGAEALVRWYDPKKDVYRSPATFLPLFEANGFITKLDRHIYYKVCEFIGMRAAQHLKVCPVSVNISRVTVLQPDFLDYYVSVKKKFKIADDFITLEFTESVAYENYEMLNSITTILHRNGFLCSIDDFGTGYSSYNILKVMNMDEIKLDRFFISRGTNENRDKLILESVIHVAKQLRMKVTQEGVESQESMEYLRSIGCDVVQGYYYSKPLAMLEFIRFLEKGDDNGKTVSAAGMDMPQ